MDRVGCSFILQLVLAGDVQMGLLSGQLQSDPFVDVLVVILQIRARGIGPHRTDDILEVSLDSELEIHGVGDSCVIASPRCPATTATAARRSGGR